MPGSGTAVPEKSPLTLAVKLFNVVLTMESCGVTFAKLNVMLVGSKSAFITSELNTIESVGSEEVSASDEPVPKAVSEKVPLR